MGLDPLKITDAMRRCLPKEAKKALGKQGLTFEEALFIADVRNEKQLQRMVAALLNYHGIPFSNPRMDRKTTIAKGVPDFLFTVGKNGKGQGVAWEIKTPTGELTPEQIDTIHRFYVSGWRTAVVRSIQDAIKFLKELNHAMD